MMEYVASFFDKLDREEDEEEINFPFFHHASSHVGDNQCLGQNTDYRY
jgi:hypothetical protein